MPTPLARQTASPEVTFPTMPVDDLDAMRAFLDRLHPRTGSEALRALRETFPLSPLALRVEAMMHHAAS